MAHLQIVSPRAWLDAVHELRAEEKAATRQLDALAAKRRRLPAVEVDRDHRFTGPDGEVGMLDLFEGRRQLLVYHFMLPPDDDHVCEGCAMFVDQLPHLAHLHARDTSLATDAGDSFALSVFLRDDDTVYRTYVTDGRGVETLGTVWTLLDLTPFGRQETWEDTPAGRPQGPPYVWWRLHDELGAQPPRPRSGSTGPVGPW